ncbi:MAG: HTTM domain-containing protein [Crocinitomicaceae bacterium]
MTGISQIRQFFNWHEHTSAAPLAVYRIGFGILMLFSTMRFLLNGWVESQYIEPHFHFPYLGFEWVPYPSESLIYSLFIGMIIGSILIILGLFYRFGAFLFFFSFTYVELLDKTNYLNHYYFVSLVAFLLVLIPANRYFSLDARLGLTNYSKTCPKWHIGLLQFQIAIVYIFAGIAKLESDWLFHAQPLKYWLHTAHHYDFIGPILKQDWVAYFFAWFGCIYDLTIVFFLLTKKTRPYAYFFVIVFHITTWLLFPIGVFPWVMIMATLIFFEAYFHERILNFIRLLFGHQEAKRSGINTALLPKKMTTALIGAYLAVQLLIPFRYLFYEGNLFWKEQGFRFSWRVMLMEKAGYAMFYVIDPKTKSEIEINNSKYLTQNQEKMMSTQPDMILQYAHYLQDVYSDTTVIQHGVSMEFNKPEIHAEIYVTLNGRPNQLYVDKKHDLAQIDNDLSERKWVEDFVK